MKFIGIIPARYNSERLPGKPLADICGKPMIQHVYERARKVLDDVFVATDSKIIFDVVTCFGGKVIMTPLICNSGTDRCYHAYQKIKRKMVLWHDDVIINIQGDQPLLHEDHIDNIIAAFQDSYNESPEVVTVAFRQEKINYLSSKYDPDSAFVIFDVNKNALYFSRFILPYCKNGKHIVLYQHIGIYGYAVKALIDFFNMDQSSLELSESLEQNRWLENGRKIKVVISGYSNMSVDTKQDLNEVRSIMEIKNKMKEL
ncbi:hypothetical protein LCGC14_2922990 [marine sediment metagenome]|uniref:3-deoxy-manno-octulosonate cytidylyltransferase n=1 Tax=marine sediment metagenome TaxID=412755 RepID=A0A0F9AE94_9ZZZZ